MQQLGDVRFERDQVRRILHVPANRHRAGDVLVNEAERSAEQVDAGGDDRRPNPGIVQHERFDEIVDVAAVVRREGDAAARRGVDRQLLVLADAFDLAENRVERIFEGAVQLVALRGPQLVEVSQNPGAGDVARQPVTAFQKPRHFLACQDCFGNVVHQRNR